ncbi:MAG: hypothetical protein K0V04_10960 [Deltaproteobacteria bacterium]|nr:hypothetical protein [Deltaproteobacteria bacterium]
MMAPPPAFGVLDEAQRRRLAAGEHEALAQDLSEAARHALAGWVREQIWDFEGALRCYREADRPVDALRMALEAGAAPALDTMLDTIERADESTFEAAVTLLRQRRRDMEVARLLASRETDPEAQAAAMLRAGNRLGAAQALATAGRPRDALEALQLSDQPSSPLALALAARLAWDLGDAEGAARQAQAALRDGERSPELAALLARALGSLGHDLAAQLVLQRHGAQPTNEAIPGRYRVTGLLPAGLAGAAYVGVDRVTLQEVEIHLLLADQPEPIDPRIAAAVDTFTVAAQTAAAVGHPAIRPVLRAEPAAGLLVLARAEGPPVRQMIRPPGLVEAVPRARALLAFLLGGLIAAHERGLVHGPILPSLVVTDALGRPQLGPFGGHHLAGLAATRTGGLEELMVLTAPELRRGAPPTPASDLFAVGTLMHAMLVGRLEPATEDPRVAAAERELIVGMTAEDPSERLPAPHVLERLRAPVADVRTLNNSPEAVAARSATDGQLQRLRAGVEVLADDSWEPERLDQLCATENPWFQPILDRADRMLVLAPWPDHARVLDDATDAWRRLVPTDALQLLEPPLREAVELRLRASSVVVTAAGTRMLALDDLLSR